MINTQGRLNRHSIPRIEPTPLASTSTSRITATSSRRRCSINTSSRTPSQPEIEMPPPRTRETAG
eukprot:CAMPEP_0178629708 /NCGR_PEP_ID=MMETSP0698-20121128/10096_1 /TAXON_ID=265572 /ORGANISM="Extubocellulus spinifer, Strain CCMP396" /LENGTH=64 /DNA_ID=CAMNT_0020269037 /DNA_START=237 /DNA_END=428 /DNA_ORIENTATION=-